MCKSCLRFRLYISFFYKRSIRLLIKFFYSIKHYPIIFIFLFSLVRIVEDFNIALFKFISHEVLFENE